MENEEKIVYLKQDTRRFAVVASVIISILTAIVLIVGFFVGNEKDLLLTVYALGSAFLVFLTAIFMGIMQIKVFNDYRSKKYVCADGVFCICITVLSIVTLLIGVTGEAAQDKAFIVLALLCVLYAAWKLVLGVVAVIKKKNNALIEILVGLLWLSSGIFIFLFVKSSIENVIMFMAISNLLLLVSEVCYMLISYIFKSPDYLDTELARMLWRKAEADRIARRQRYDALTGVAVKPAPIYVAPAADKDDESIEEKLEKLQALYDKKLITEDEYKASRKKILDENI